MVHWLEEIERQESKKKRSGRDSARVQDKMFRIKQNYENESRLYNHCILKLDALAERVNNLPVEHREIFGKITFKAKQTRLDNKLHYFSSSRRVQKTEFGGLLNPLKNVHYKHVRLIYFNIAKIMDKVEIEVKEEFLEKKRRDGKLEDDHKSHSVKPKDERKDRFHQVYYYDMSNLTDEFAFKIIDWLTFHENIDHLPVIHDGETRF